MSDNVPERVIRFPSDRSLGMVSVRPYGEINEDGRVLGPANGDIVVPAGMEMCLCSSADELGDFSVLQTLPADALGGIELLNATSDTDQPVDARRNLDRMFRSLARFTALHELDVRDINVTLAGMKDLRELTCLRSLNLGGTPIGDQELACVTALSNLETLIVSATRITDVGIQYLTSLPSLRHLSLSATQVTDSGVQLLGGLPSLRSLDLACTRSTDRGLVPLSTLSQLAHLDLRATLVTDEGLAQLKRLTNLADLRVSQPRVTSVGVTLLKNALSNLHVVIEPRHQLRCHEFVEQFQPQ